MYLKRLDVCGFKSFADKLRLEFDKGITAIIGPNGCGKSNTSDSIRWCLGEHSARSLRSHQMLDVLFNGSNSRQPTGMAEVSLTFDNSDKAIQIDYSEVMVTRRLFRSGESEYFINKTQCRLKDIKDMFLDTGVGTEGYSIMEQGRVKFLLEAKPEERREIFEEAAGVAKFKARREETLRKLEKIEIDMNRVNDMLALLKEQRSSLDAAARKAKLYKKHAEDLKRFEIAAIVKQVSESQKGSQEAKVKLDPKTLSYEQLNAQYNSIEAELSQIRVEQLEKERVYELLQDEYSKIHSAMNLADERVNQSGVRETEMSERKAQLESEIEALSLRIANTANEIEKTNKIIAEIGSSVSKYEVDFNDKKAKNEIIKAELSALVLKVETFKGKLLELISEKTTQTNDLNRIISLQARCGAQLENAQKEKLKVEEKIKPLTVELESKISMVNEVTLSFDGASSQKQQLAKRIVDLESELAQEMRNMSQSREVLFKFQAKFNALKDWERKDIKRKTLNDVLSQNIPGIRGALSALISINETHKDVIISTLAEKLDYIVCDNTKAAEMAIDFLRSNSLGWASFLVLDSGQINNNLHFSLPSGSKYLTDFIEAPVELRNALSFLLGGAAMGDKNVYSDAIIRGGGKVEFDKPMLIEEQYKEMQTGIADANASSERSSAAIIKIEEELKNVRLESENAIMQAQKIFSQKENLENNVKTTTLSLNYLQKDLMLATEDAQKALDEEQKLKDFLEQTKLKISKYNQEETVLKQSLSDLEKEVEDARQKDAQSTPLLMESKVVWLTQQKEFTSRQREGETLEGVLLAQKIQIEQNKKEIEAIVKKIEELNHTREKEAVKFKELNIKLEEKQAQIRQFYDNKQKINNNIDEKNTQVRGFRQKLDDLNLEINELRMNEKSYSLQLNSAQRRLRDDFGLEYADIAAEFEKIEVAIEDIARLKNKIESIGAVNLAAPEEYAALEERYNFLLVQQQDLLKAKDDLKSAITKINQSTIENFRKTFEQVRENFKGLYKTLFNGGEAELTLTDENNLLESGIDVFAQPPGKKLLNISALSGGEKALTAIALLFAFFMVKPSPFCILDEVDAPLDEANLGRFINLLKTFSEKTQFLVITHSKKTMESADVLYGVTMEELGVSKVISVKLQKTENIVQTA